MKNGQKSILLIVSGGIAAYKMPDLIRQLSKQNISITCIMTKAAEQFVTPLTLASLSGTRVYTHLFDLKDESEIGHIQLSRQADLVVVAPATANIIAKMAHGIADNLATTCLLATDKPVLIAPAMNVKMWEHSATQRNISQLIEDGAQFCGPEDGAMACGETGFGRMSEPEILAETILNKLNNQQNRPHASQPSEKRPLTGRSVLVTAGPTHEAIDPVRYIANRSSGKQGYALAQEAAKMGAKVTLVSGPTNLLPPEGVKTVQVTSAIEMLAAAKEALPVDLAICAAAVADWRISNPSNEKMKKTSDSDTLTLNFSKNPDILHAISNAKEKRPKLVVGFAAETENILHNAQTKRERKNCDIIIANNVGAGTKTFGGNDNSVHFITEGYVESWDEMSKTDVAIKILNKIFEYIKYTS